VFRYRHFVSKWLKTSVVARKCKDKGLEIIIHCHLIGKNGNWTKNMFYIVKHLEEAFTINVHEFKLDPYKGIIFESTTCCEDTYDGQCSTLDNISENYFTEYLESITIDNFEKPKETIDEKRHLSQENSIENNLQSNTTPSDIEHTKIAGGSLDVKPGEPSVQE